MTDKNQCKEETRVNMRKSIVAMCPNPPRGIRSSQSTCVKQKMHAQGGFYALPTSPSSLISASTLSAEPVCAGACGELADGVGMAMDAGVEAADSPAEGTTKDEVVGHHETLDRPFQTSGENILTEQCRACPIKYACARRQRQIC